MVYFTSDLHFWHRVTFGKFDGSSGLDYSILLAKETNSPACIKPCEKEAEEVQDNCYI